MASLRDITAYFFTVLDNILIRVEFLVVLVAVMSLAMFILDIYRRQFHYAGIIGSILGAADSVSNSIVIYILGLGATHPLPVSSNLFAVWIIVLLSFRSSVNYISRTGIHDSRWFQFNEMANVINVLGVPLMYIGIRDFTFTPPFLSLCIILTLKSIYRCVACEMAIKSFSHGQSSKLLPAYFNASHGQSSFRVGHDQFADPMMEGHKLLVYGESKPRIEFRRPRYIPYLDIIHKESHITLDKILRCDEPLLNSSNNRGGFNFKDLCLAFSLSRLLRCKSEGVSLHRDIIIMTKQLITPRIMEEDKNCTGRALFSILELEIAFVRDYYYSTYPIIFCNGLCSLSFSILQSVATIIVVCWLAFDLRKTYNVYEYDVKSNAATIITWVFMVFIVFKETWEIVTYLLTNWTRLLLACKYVQHQYMCRRKPAMEKFIRCFMTSNIADPWHGFINQYDFLRSFHYKPKFWNLMHHVTVGLVPRRSDGQTPGRAIKIPGCVRPAIIQELRSLDLSGRQLLKDIPALGKHDMFGRFGWACLKLPTCSHVILAWHIATSLCEIKLAKERGINLNKPGFMCSILSSLTQFCCSPQPYLIKEHILEGQLQMRYSVANSLSRYCAYMVASQSLLLPDNFLVPKVSFKNAVRDACKMLKDCDSLLDMFRTLIKVSEGATQNKDEMKRSGNIVEIGAILGKELIDLEDTELCWEILAGVWADLLIHISPSWKAQAHVECLKSGGEFITHIWALLWHCGIEESRLWFKDEASGDSGHAPQGKNAETNNTQSVVVTQQAGVEIRDHCIRIGARNEDGIESSEQSEIRNLRRKQKCREGTWRSEIEEVSVKEGMVVEEPETLKGMVEKSQRKSRENKAGEAGKSMVVLTPIEMFEESTRKGKNKKTQQGEPCMMSSRTVDTGEAIAEQEQKSARVMKNVEKNALKECEMALRSLELGSDGTADERLEEGQPKQAQGRAPR